MSRIRSKDTTPEKTVRSLLHGMGFRFRLQGKVASRLHHKGRLPGNPDMVLAKYRTVIFVHGCFWHRHEGCKYATTPGTRTDWWKAKFARNVQRDRRGQAELRSLNWQVIIVWECELRDPTALAERLDHAIRREPLQYPDRPARELLVADGEEEPGPGDSVTE